MAGKTVRLTAPNGATVEVADGRVERLVRYGFAESKTTVKKTSSGKSEK